MRLLTVLPLAPSLSSLQSIPFFMRYLLSSQDVAARHFFFPIIKDYPFITESLPRGDSVPCWQLPVFHWHTSPPREKCRWRYWSPALMLTWWMLACWKR